MIKVYQALGYSPNASYGEDRVVIALFTNHEEAQKAVDYHWSVFSKKTMGNLSVGDVKERTLFESLEEMHEVLKKSTAEKALSKLTPAEKKVLKDAGYLVDKPALKDSLAPTLSNPSIDGRLPGHCYHDRRHHLWNAGGYQCDDCGQNDWNKDLKYPKKLDDA